MDKVFDVDLEPEKSRPQPEHDGIQCDINKGNVGSFCDSCKGPCSSAAQARKLWRTQAAFVSPLEEGTCFGMAGRSVDRSVDLRVIADRVLLEFRVVPVGCCATQIRPTPLRPRQQSVLLLGEQTQQRGSCSGRPATSNQSTAHKKFAFSLRARPLVCSPQAIQAPAAGPYTSPEHLWPKKEWCLLHLVFLQYE